MSGFQRSITPVYPTEPIFPLSVDQYHEMIRAGVLSDDDPVELIEGALVFHMPKNPPHRIATRKLTTLMDELLPERWFYQSQDSITLLDGEPEPDGAIIRGSVDDYPDRHPGPADIGIVIEVSDSTLARDRGMKLRSYARSGIEAYWMVNLEARTIERYSQPIQDGESWRYDRREDFGSTQAVPVVLGGQVVGEIAVAELLTSSSAVP